MSCSNHPLASHGFLRGSSLTNEDYVCECQTFEEPHSMKRIGHDTYLVKWHSYSSYIEVVKEGGVVLAVFSVDDLDYL